MAIKELQTRIALKYDSYSAWKDSTLELLPGELGICEIPGTTTKVLDNGKEVEVTTAPTVLFKVGAYKKDVNGNNTTELQQFKDLPWASAKAADVYQWAKAATVGYTDDKQLVFKDAAGQVVYSVDLSNVASVVELTAVSDAVAAIDSRVASIEASVGSNSVVDTLEDLDGRLAALEGDDGEIATKVAAAVVTAKDYADANLVTAKDYTDAAETRMAASIEALDSSVAGNTASISELSGSLTEATQEHEADITAINNKIGEGYSDKTITEAVSANATAITTVSEALTALADGAVSTNTSAIESLTATVAADKAELQAADADLDSRLSIVEDFFVGAETDDESNLQKAYDTLADIQDYIDTHGEVATTILADISTNKTNIASNTLAIAAVDSSVATVTADVAGLAQTLSEVSGVANQGVADAAAVLVVANEAKAQAAANLEAITDSTTGNAALAAAISALDSDLAGTNSAVAEAEDAIAALEAVTTTGADANATLRSDLTELTTVVNQKAELLDEVKTAAETTDATVAQHDSDIATIKAEYVHQDDYVIFYCGNASENDFTA